MQEPLCLEEKNIYTSRDNLDNYQNKICLSLLISFSQLTIYECIGEYSVEQ